ncbi:MAG: K(+)-transporting ATPase subunit F [Casimicrobiaceae bacterium]|jgi:K+-transporting ATPase KdpF subunit
MTALYFVASVVTMGLFVYLLYALFKAEDF